MPNVPNPLARNPISGQPTKAVPPPPPPSKKKTSTGPPTPPPPPAPAAKNIAPSTAFNSFINAHPIMRPYADTIAKWAKFYGVDATVMGALFWRESFAVATSTGADPATITSPTGAGVGIGQINPIHVGEKTPWGAKVTQSDLTNPEFNIRWSSYYFSTKLAKFGNIDAAYSQGYNPGYGGPPLSSILPKNYVPSSTLSPTQAASAGQEKAGAENTLKDPWVVLTKHGIAYVNAVNPPKNVLTYGGAPVSRNGLWNGSASFTATWNQVYADQFQAFTDRKPTAKEIASILADAPSIYTLQTELSGKQSFVGSPFYKAHAPGLLAAARSIMGSTFVPPKGLIATALGENWDQATFEEKIRELPSYEKSNEFQTNYANNESAWESTYGGNPDANVKGLLTDLTKKGWTPPQVQAWLMQQPAYKQTPSYQAKQLGLLSQLGLITGAVPTLSKDQADQSLTAGDQLKAPVSTQLQGTQTTKKPSTAPPVAIPNPGQIQGESKNSAPFTRPV